MTAEESYSNYLTHTWKSSPSNPFDSREMDTYCDACGIEDQGDPREFDWLEYPNCDKAQEEEQMERYECATCCYATNSYDKFLAHGKEHSLEKPKPAKQEITIQEKQNAERWSNRVDFISWFDKSLEDSIPTYPDDFTRDQLKDYIFDALWNRMEDRGGIIPEDDSLS